MLKYKFSRLFNSGEVLNTRKKSTKQLISLIMKLHIIYIESSVKLSECTKHFIRSLIKFKVRIYNTYSPYKGFVGITY